MTFQPQNPGGAGATDTPMPVSMTGYARSTGTWQDRQWVWEARSVNGKGLDVRLRLPTGCDALEPKIREAAGRFCRRGSLTLSLDLRQEQAAAGFTVNRAMIDQVLALQNELGHRIEQTAPRLEALLMLRGMIDNGERGPVTTPVIEEPELCAALFATLDTALAALAEMRQGEGARLAAVLAGQLDEIEKLVQEARAVAAQQPGLLMERLRRQIATLLEGIASLPEERLAQEAALLANRTDATEELDRLTAHVAAARELLASGEAVGRRLDFLAQEFNREANTLTSKANDIGVTRTGLALKTAIDQFREQIQNIE